MSSHIEFVIIFLSVITYSSEHCTRNSKFNEVVKDPRTIYLCETNSSCTKRFLKDREYYYGCVIEKAKQVESFSIYIHEASDNNESIVRVLVGDKWEKRKTSFHYREVVYITTLLNANEYFSVECGFGLKPARNQFPDLDQNKYQFPDFYKYYDDSIHILYHSQIIDCVSDCKENPIEIVRLDKFEDQTKIMGNSIHINYANDTNQIYKNLLRFSCGGNTKKNKVTMSFKYAEHYNISIWDSYGQIGKLKIYDLWERFSCQISFFAKHNNMPVTTLQISNMFIYMKVSNSPYSRSGYLTAWDTKEIVIDLNVSLFHQLDLMCYLGNHNGITDKSLEHTVWNFGVIETVTIKGKYETKLLYADWADTVGDNLEEDRLIKCDIDYLGEIAKIYNPGEIRPYNKKEIQISYINRDHGTYPLSRMVPLKPKKYTKIQFQKIKNFKTFFFCFVDEYYSIPRFFKAVPARLYVSIYNIFPPWNHTFSLPLFVYGCRASQLAYWDTSNPKDKFDVKIENQTKSFIYLIISKDIKMDKYMKFTCTAKSKINGSVSKTKQFNTIVNYQVRLNYKSKERFYLEGDSFGCIAVLNPNGSTRDSGHIMPMPSLINCDGLIDMTNKNTTVSVLRTGLIQCYGCCSIFRDSKMVCETWEEINIANSYRFQWNSDLKNLDSGDFLTCSVCLNFTNGMKDQPCIDNNNFLANVGMTIRYSNSSVIEYSCFPDRFELLLPNIKVGEKIKDINISCCFRDVINSTTVKLNSFYTFQLNSDLDIVTPGKNLTCLVCQNSCESNDSVFANVGMDIHDSVSMIMHIPCSSDRYQVSLPATDFFPTKISSLKIYVTCCYQDIIKTMSFRKEECTSNRSYYTLDNKVIFGVTDSVACSTWDQFCTAAAYTNLIIEFYNSEKITPRNGVFEFSEKYLGFSGKLTCIFPNSMVIKIDIMVQNPPYNLSIRFLQRLMVPGTNLTCSASGYPVPVLSWIQIAGASKFRVVKNSLLIRLFDISGLYLAKCEARNFLETSEQIVQFEVFNPKALSHIDSKWFFVYVPLLSITAILAMAASLIFIFQEAVFGVPLFSTYKAYPTKLDLSKRSNKEKAIPDIGRQSFIAHTERLIQNSWLHDD